MASLTFKAPKCVLLIASEFFALNETAKVSSGLICSYQLICCIPLYKSSWVFTSKELNTSKIRLAVLDHKHAR